MGLYCGRRQCAARSESICLSASRGCRFVSLYHPSVYVCNAGACISFFCAFGLSQRSLLRLGLFCALLFIWFLFLNLWCLLCNALRAWGACVQVYVQQLRQGLPYRESFGGVSDEGTAFFLVVGEAVGQLAGSTAIVVLRKRSNRRRRNPRRALSKTQLL